MVNDKKKVTLDDVVNQSAGEIVEYFQSHTSADFKTRMAKFEEFHHPKHEIPEIFGQHVENVVRGNPDDREKSPGAYDIAYKKMASMLKGRFDKLENRDDALAIIEAYVDQFLTKAHSNRFEEAMKHAKEEGLTPDQIRSMKGVYFMMYHPPDQRTGRRLNPFSEEFIKGLVGKTRLKIEQQLRAMANSSVSAYSQYLISKATEGLLKEEEHLEIAKYVGGKFKSAGFHDPTRPSLTKTVDDLVADYSTLLQGGNLQERGYEKTVEQPAKKS
ncbi:hypothetical protein HYV85_03595 [Candidatus Woesearchaeota archaeon]|nr:hypothetical protein [Candidatus Woesearchaeota archaeon]